MKGQIEIQFNWIFVMVAGALILALFVGLIVRHTSLSESSMCISVLTDMDKLLTSAQSAENTITELKVPNEEFKFDCDSMYCKNVNKDLKKRIVFSPQIMRSKFRKIISWSRPWKKPYKVADFLYLTQPDITYYFIYSTQNSGDANDVINNWPEKIPYEEITTNNILIKPRADYATRLVFFDSNIGDSSNLPTFTNSLNSKFISKYSALFVDSKDKSLTFYVYENKEWIKLSKTKYYDLNTLFGAIFTDNVVNYNCNLRYALEKYYRLNDLYKKRVELLSSDSNNCINILRNSLNYFGDLSTTQNCINELKKSYDDVVNPSDFTNSGCISDENTLKSENQQVIEQSCPNLY